MARQRVNDGTLFIVTIDKAVVRTICFSGTVNGNIAGVDSVRISEQKRRDIDCGKQ